MENNINSLYKFALLDGAEIVDMMVTDIDDQEYALVTFMEEYGWKDKVASEEYAVEPLGKTSQNNC